MSRARWWAGLALLLCAAGCGTPNRFQYVVTEAVPAGWRIVTAPSAASVLADPDQPADRREALRRVTHMRHYAREVLDWEPGRALTRVHPEPGPMAWVVTAAPPDRLEPVTWWFPVAGEVPYLGYRDRADAERIAARLAACGHDTRVRPAAAFSTLGALPDPLAVDLLDGPLEHLAETVFHELAHGEIHSTRSADFNEAVATHLGRHAALDWLRRAGHGDAVARLERAHAVRDARAAWARDTAAHLRRLYAADLPRPEVIALRERVFADARAAWERQVAPLRDPDNAAAERESLADLDNTRILSLLRYTGRASDHLAVLHHRLHGDLAALTDTLRPLADTDHPLRALRRAAE